MSRRSSTSPWRSAFARLTAVDRDRLAVAVIVGGTVLAFASVVLGGFAPYGLLADVFYPLAVLLPAIGVVVAFGACWWATVAGSSTGEPPLLADLDGPPERGQSRTENPVALETTWLLEDGTDEWYRCQDGTSTGTVRERLADGAVRTLRAKRGLERRAAREAVRSGTWTDNDVAAAFLAADVRQPVEERLRAAVDPGGAFDRRVRRTLAAIESIADDSRPLEVGRERDRTPTVAEAVANANGDADDSGRDGGPAVAETEVLSDR
ncbi:DUF7269 family protein [Halopiger xanaduensis]|uniref:Uncharacterized protein n=1 Tax=Halopiger xanaduensis (strain DSM 18323 / JCM 14033 / SH-6) TaxID=797210 RepID=F8D5T9_HALXS|nr:hypothetical protein [Halopiger xanaduensis]AEH36519.1 hypothetical protein Halxa_1892 [Halopiger xanaduensis SH-6]